MRNILILIFCFFSVFATGQAVEQILPPNDTGDHMVVGELGTITRWEKISNFLQNDWGLQVVESDATLTGVGIIGNELKVDTTLIATQNYVTVQDSNGIFNFKNQDNTIRVTLMNQEENITIKQNSVGGDIFRFRSTGTNPIAQLEFDDDVETGKLLISTSQSPFNFATIGSTNLDLYLSTDFSNNSVKLNTDRNIITLITDTTFMNGERYALGIQNTAQAGVTVINPTTRQESFMTWPQVRDSILENKGIFSLENQLDTAEVSEFYIPTSTFSFLHQNSGASTLGVVRFENKVNQNAFFDIQNPTNRARIGYSTDDLYFTNYHTTGSPTIDFQFSGIGTRMKLEYAGDLLLDTYLPTRDDGALTNLMTSTDVNGRLGIVPIQTLYDSVSANLVSEGGVGLSFYEENSLVQFTKFFSAGWGLTNQNWTDVDPTGVEMVIDTTELRTLFHNPRNIDSVVVDTLNLSQGGTGRVIQVGSYANGDPDTLQFRISEGATETNVIAFTGDATTADPRLELFRPAGVNGFRFEASRDGFTKYPTSGSYLQLTTAAVLTSTTGSTVSSYAAVDMFTYDDDDVTLRSNINADNLGMSSLILDQSSGQGYTELSTLNTGNAEYQLALLPSNFILDGAYLGEHWSFSSDTVNYITAGKNGLSFNSTDGYFFTNRELGQALFSGNVNLPTFGSMDTVMSVNPATGEWILTSLSAEGLGGMFNSVNQSGTFQVDAVTSASNGLTITQGASNAPFIWTASSGAYPRLRMENVSNSSPSLYFENASSANTGYVTHISKELILSGQDSVAIAANGVDMVTISPDNAYFETGNVEIVETAGVDNTFHLHNTNAQRAFFDVTGRQAVLRFTSYSNTGTSSNIWSNFRARGTEGTPLDVQAGDVLWQNQGRSYINGAFQTGNIRIGYLVGSSTPSVSNFHTEMVFETTAQNSTTIAERMSIDGDVVTIENATAFQLEDGNTASRPTAYTGGIRWNTDSSGVEVYDGSAWETLATHSDVIADVETKAITAEDPTATENITIFFTDVAITITQVNDVVQGTTPSLTWNIAHATTRNNGTPNEVWTVDRVTTSESGAETTTFNDATIPAGSWVWLTTSAQSGTTDEFNVTFEYTYD